MTLVNHARMESSRNLEELFRSIYTGFINGIRVPTEGVQQARFKRTNGFEGIAGTNDAANQNEWIKVHGKANKKVIHGRKKQLESPRRSKRIGERDRNN